MVKITITNIPDTQICSWCKELKIGYWRPSEFVCSECWSYEVEKLKNIPVVEEENENTSFIFPE